MLDAAGMALHEMKKGRNPRKAILIISDGGDNNSRYSAHEIQSLVREADVQIYAMGVFEPVLTLGMTPEEISGPREFMNSLISKYGLPRVRLAMMPPTRLAG